MRSRGAGHAQAMHRPGAGSLCGSLAAFLTAHPLLREVILKLTTPTTHPPVWVVPSQCALTWYARGAHGLARRVHRHLPLAQSAARRPRRQP